NAYPGTGNDTAFLTDSAGNDNFTATPTYARMQGPGYLNTAYGFRTANGYAGSGGTDYAYLYDSAGYDAFGGTPTYARMVGSGYANYAYHFSGVQAYSSGGND